MLVLGDCGSAMVSGGMCLVGLVMGMLECDTDGLLAAAAVVDCSCAIKFLVASLAVGLVTDVVDEEAGAGGKAKSVELCCL